MDFVRILDQARDLTLELIFRLFPIIFHGNLCYIEIKDSNVLVLVDFVVLADLRIGLEFGVINLDDINVFSTPKSEELYGKQNLVYLYFLKYGVLVQVFHELLFLEFKGWFSNHYVLHHSI